LEGWGAGGSGRAAGGAGAGVGGGPVLAFLGMGLHSLASELNLST